MGVPAEAAQADEAKPVKCPGRVSVLVEEVVPSIFMEYRRLQKSIIPQMSGEFTCPFPGSVKTIRKGAGSEVQTGDVVLLLDEAPIQREIEQAQADLKRWKRILFQRENWKVRRPRAEAQAKRNIKNIEDLVAEKQEELKKCTVTSPANGIISELRVKEGDSISSGFVLGTIINIDRVRITLDDYLDKFRDSQILQIKIDELNKVVPGTVQKDSDEGAFIYIANPDKSIKPGMTAKFRILFQEHQKVVVLPKGKILKDDSGAYVYVVNEKRARKAALKTGPVEKDMVLIREGLSGGDEIIVSEVLSAKLGTLRDALTCVQDNKKIKIVVFDQAKRKYVKRKKDAAKTPVSKKPVKKAKPVKMKPKPAVTPPKVEKKKDVKKEVPKKVEPPVKKEVKPEPEKEVEPEQPDPVEVFIDYLNNNKNTLKYKKYKKFKENGSVVVVVTCDINARKRLVPIIDKFNITRFSVVKTGDLYEVEAYFFIDEKAAAARKARVRARLARKAPTRVGELRKFRIGVHGNYYKMNNPDFENIYGRMTGIGLDFSYTINEKFDVWASIATGSKVGEIPDWPEAELKFKFTPISIDGRYFFKRSLKYDFFAGAGLNIVSFQDDNPLEVVKDSAVGVNLLGGAYYHINDRFSVQFMFRYNIVKKTITSTEIEVDNDLDLTSPELLFGFTYSF
jgi:RND family efflux transporter MFP subunit